jgi:phosphate uptake regulator
MRALRERDGAPAEEIVGRDRQVDIYDIEVDEQCAGRLALHPPIAGDRRHRCARPTPRSTR